MPTIDIVVRKDRPDAKTGLFDVKVRVTQKGKPVYFSTGRLVSPTELDKELNFKRADKLKHAAEVLAYTRKLEPLSGRVATMTAREIAAFLQLPDEAVKEPQFIDLVAETIAHAQTLKKNYRNSFLSSINAFKDMTRQNKFDVNHLTSDVLRKFENHIKSPKTIIRNDIKGRPREDVKKGGSNTTVNVYITNLKTVFELLKARYNGERADQHVIPHDPFSKYKFPKKERPTKRNLKPAVILDIRDYPKTQYMGTHGTNRVELAQDVFMLSFYLLGMNTVDLYNVKTFKNGRLEYNRTKTESRRKDDAFISVKVEPEAEALLQKYLDPTGQRVFVFHKMYSDSNTFNKNVNKGLKKMVQLCDQNSALKGYEDITSYYARHSWGTIARNICNIHKENIGEGLNHASKHDVTDLYLEKDWTLLDGWNRQVLDVLKDQDKSLQQEYEIEEQEFVA